MEPIWKRARNRYLQHCSRLRECTDRIAPVCDEHFVRGAALAALLEKSAIFCLFLLFFCFFLLLSLCLITPSISFKYCFIFNVCRRQYRHLSQLILSNPHSQDNSSRLLWCFVLSFVGYLYIGRTMFVFFFLNVNGTFMCTKKKKNKLNAFQFTVARCKCCYELLLFQRLYQNCNNNNKKRDNEIYA